MEERQGTVYYQKEMEEKMKKKKKDKKNLYQKKMGEGNVEAGEGERNLINMIRKMK